MECPSLTTLTPTTILLTLHNVYELQVSTWARTPGTRVQVKCHTGLTLQGQDIVTCLATGKWDLSPLPKCVDPPPPTTTPPPPSVDTSLVLMIVLICVMVMVTIVMIILCIALCHSYKRRMKTKQNRYPGPYENSTDTVSEPDSILRRGREDMQMRTTHTNYHHHHQHNDPVHSPYVDDTNPTTTYDIHLDYPDAEKTPEIDTNALEIRKPVMSHQPERQQHKPAKTGAQNIAFESDDNFIMKDPRYPLPHKLHRRDEEYTITYVPVKVERNQIKHEPPPEAMGHHGPHAYKRNDRYRRGRPHKALSVDAAQDKSEGNPQDQRRPYSDITAYYGSLFYDDSSDAEDEFWNRKGIKRDYFLWRDMPASFNSLRLPRPHYRP